MSAQGVNRKLSLLMHKSEDEIKAVNDLIGSGHYRIAISRCYYIVFYAACALLASRGLAFAKHSAVVSFFGKEFASKDKQSRQMHRILIELFELRNDADYKLSPDPKKEEAEKQLELAKKFHDWVKNQLPL